MATHELRSWLTELQHRLRTQDNACTADPVYIVQQRRRIIGMDPAYDGEFTWVEDGEECSGERCLEHEAYYEATGDEPEGCTRAAYIDTYEFVQAFFTKQAAMDYITRNAHRMTDPRVYVESAYRNTEWQTVVKLLLSLDPEKLP